MLFVHIVFIFYCVVVCCFVFFFFFNDTATTEIYTLSLHDALPIILQSDDGHILGAARLDDTPGPAAALRPAPEDRKSTRLNSSHVSISYAVFCLKKKKDTYISTYTVKNSAAIAILV